MIIYIYIYTHIHRRYYPIVYTTGWYNSFYTNSQKRGISLSSNGWRNYKLLRIRS